MIFGNFLYGIILCFKANIFQVSMYVFRSCKKKCLLLNMALPLLQIFNLNITDNFACYRKIVWYLKKNVPLQCVKCQKVIKFKGHFRSTQQSNFWHLVSVIFELLLHGSKSQYFFSNLNSNCSNLLDMRNLQEQVKKHFVTKNCSDLSLFEQIVLVIENFFEIF